MKNMSNKAEHWLGVIKCQKVFRVYSPKGTDPRNCPRVRTKNLISYSVFNQSGKVISRGLGIALDISEGGILLAKPNCVNSALVNLTATDIEKNLKKVKGKIIRAKKASSGMYLYGIKFIGGNKRVTQFVATVIKEYNFRRDNLTLKLKQRIKN